MSLAVDTSAAQPAAALATAINDAVPPKQTDTQGGDQTPPKDGASDQSKDKIDDLVKREVARHRQAITRKMKDLEDRERRLEEKERSLGATQTNDWKQKLQEDPFEFLEENGLTYDQLTEKHLNRPQDAEIRRLEAKIQKLLEAQEDASTKQAAAKNEQYEQAKKQIKQEVKILIDSDESYETIKANGEIAQDAVVQLIEDTFQEEGYLMSVEDATKEVEDYLLEQAVSLAKLKKVQSKLAPPPAATPPTPPEKKEEPRMTTLSNRSAPSTTKDLTEEERRNRAILAFHGKLA